MITGATDGVGKAYAEALAKKGMDIVLISRTQTKLDDVAKDIGLYLKICAFLFNPDKSMNIYALR